MQVLKGYNDLLTTNPELAKEWNYEKNENLDPSTVKATSEKKVWWKCEKGHEWKTSINCRNQGNGCKIRIRCRFRCRDLLQRLFWCVRR